MSQILAAQRIPYASTSSNACLRGFGAKQPSHLVGCALRSQNAMQTSVQRTGGICQAASAHGVSTHLEKMFFLFYAGSNLKVLLPVYI